MSRWAGALVLIFATAARAQPSPVAIFRQQAPADGFIDDAFALREDGKSIAFITRDGSSRSILHIAALGSTPGGAAREVPGLPDAVTAVYWVGDDRLLVVTREAQSLRGQIFTSKGPSSERLGPAERIALATACGKPSVVASSRTGKRGGDETVIAYDRATWKIVARKTLHLDAEGRIVRADSALKPLWWYRGHTQLATLKSGEFDKARDIRRPDRFTRMDLFAERFTDEREIEDPLGLARALVTHHRHPDEDAFIELSEDHHKLLLTDGLVENELTLARPVWLYDPDTLAYQLLDDGRLALSLTVDPVNPEALRRKKADPDDLDLYLVDREHHAASLALRLAGQGRPSRWRMGGGRIGILRKSKGFEQGGVALEVYDVATPTAHRD